MQRKKDVTKLIYYIVGTVSAFVFLYAAFRLLSYYGESRRETVLYKELAQIREDAADQTDDGQNEDVKDDGEKKAETREDVYRRLKEKNADYVCWLTVEDTQIDCPVVKRDNTFYLTHDFSGEKNSHGSVFMDEACSVGDAVVLLHGHHMKDGTMFAPLVNYKKKEFCQSHDKITLEYEDMTDSYTIFAVLKVDLTDETSFRFEEIPETEEEMRHYLDYLKTASFWLSGEKVHSEDELLLLSTCDYDTDDERLIVAAYKEKTE